MDSDSKNLPDKRRKGSRQRGQSLVEFALVIPLFLVLVFGIIDFGLGLKSWITITNAAREGARFAAITCSTATNDDGVIATTEEAAADLSDDVTVTVTNCPGDATESVTVAVEYDYELITPLGGMLSVLGGGVGLPASIGLSSSSDMRVE
jgi:Flp pilus assembly protein TadG